MLRFMPTKFAPLRSDEVTDSKTKTRIYLMFILFGVACTLLQEHVGSPFDPNNTNEIIFEVPKGSTARSIAPELEQVGLIGSADDFVLYIKISKEGGCIKAGRFSLNPSMDAQGILDTVCGVPLANDKPFTVVEGWRIREIDAALTADGWIGAGEYAALAQDPSQFTAEFTLPQNTLEGYLYPETYLLSPDNFDVKNFIQRQINMHSDVFYSPNQKEIEDSSRTMGELVIMASMLEREEPKPAQRPLVAGILWKRIDNSWNLGVDATSRYTLDEWNDRRSFLKNLRDPEEAYNTRLKSGLPPTAIGNPSVHSLEAALSPTESEYWYYLHDSQQVLHPSKNAAGHERLRAKYNVY